MSVSCIQGHPLEVTVVGCTRLRDTEWISRQDPYVCVEYRGNKFRTRTCTDGGKNPTFQEKFVFTLIEGFREINVAVWNSNTITSDDFIGSGKIHLHKVLSQGYDDAISSLQTNTGRYAGEVRLIMHYANANRAATGNANSAPPNGALVPQAHGAYYSQPPPAYPVSFPYPPSAYPPTPTTCNLSSCTVSSSSSISSTTISSTSTSSFGQLSSTTISSTSTSSFSQRTSTSSYSQLSSTTISSTSTSSFTQLSSKTISSSSTSRFSLLSSTNISTPTSTITSSFSVLSSSPISWNLSLDKDGDEDERAPLN